VFAERFGITLLGKGRIGSTLENVPLMLVPLNRNILFLLINLIPVTLDKQRT
jgi:hypothetical protein